MFEIILYNVYGMILFDEVMFETIEEARQMVKKLASEMELGDNIVIQEYKEQ